jgi:hypothetical protein
MNKSLFNISAEALEIVSALEETGELTPGIEAMLVINQNELQEKSFSYAYVCKTIEGDITTIDEEIKRLMALKKAKNNVVDRMKEAVINALHIYGLEKISSPTLTLSVRRSEAVEIISEEQLADEYKVTKVTTAPDKIRIKEAIKSGKDVEGAIIKENYSLQIK